METWKSFRHFDWDQNARGVRGGMFKTPEDGGNRLN